MLATVLALIALTASGALCASPPSVTNETTPPPYTVRHEFQQMAELHDVLSADGVLNRPILTIAYNIYNIETVWDKLTRSQKKLAYYHIACEAREQTHGTMKLNWDNKTNENDRVHMLDGRQCDNQTMEKPFYRCLCDASMVPTYCHVLHITRNTEWSRSGPLNCPDDAWTRLNASAPRIYDRMIHSFGVQAIDKVADIVALATMTGVQNTLIAKGANHSDTLFLKMTCETTVEVHGYMRRLLVTDVRMRLSDDLVRMRILAQLPISFCAADYLLSKCLCDARSSAIFCALQFLKEEQLMMKDDAFCGDVRTSSSASTSTTAGLLTLLLLLLAIHTHLL